VLPHRRTCGTQMSATKQEVKITFERKRMAKRFQWLNALYRARQPEIKMAPSVQRLSDDSHWIHSHCMSRTSQPALSNNVFQFPLLSEHPDLLVRHLVPPRDAASSFFVVFFDIGDVSAPAAVPTGPEMRTV